MPRGPAGECMESRTEPLAFGWGNAVQRVYSGAAAESWQHATQSLAPDRLSGAGLDLGHDVPRGSAPDQGRATSMSKKRSKLRMRRKKPANHGKRPVAGR